MNELITFTDNAIKYIKQSIDEEKCLGIRIDIISGGCQGMTYEMNFVKHDVNPSDLIIQESGIDIYIASRAVIFISGMVVDFVKTPMGGNIVFENPNAKAKCGCGKSFCVDEKNSLCNKTCC